MAALIYSDLVIRGKMAKMEEEKCNLPCTDVQNTSACTSRHTDAVQVNKL
jgi:hypothetical protein